MPYRLISLSAHDCPNTMPLNGTDWLESLGKWSGMAFLIAGALVSFAAIAMALVLVTDMSQGMITGLPTMVGLLVSYIGMLGLYPKLAARRRRAALTGVILLLLPVAGIAFWLGHALVIGQEPSYAGLLVGVVVGGFVFGLVVYGITSYRTRIPSRSAGLALLAFVVPWVVLLGSGVVYEGAAPAWIDFATTSVMGVLLLVIGYLTRAESLPAEREEPTPDATA